MRQFKRQIAELLRRTLGRRSLIRSGRFLLNAGRFDESNSIQYNGELRLILDIVQSAQPNKPFTAIDVGANVGEYSDALATCIKKSELSNARIIAVEASSATMAILRNRLASKHNGLIETLQIALSNHCGEAEFHLIEPGAGRNSLLPIEAESITSTESVQLSTVDQLFPTLNINHIHLLKIDTEGHDFAVLSGAVESMKERRIGVAQFEYNWRWIEQRAYLRDVFRLVQDMPYSLGKVTPSGIEYFDRWQPQLETLVENNYALVLNDLLGQYSHVKTASTW